MAMAHVILKEFYVERRTPYFEDYAPRFTDLPFLIRLDERDGELVPGRFLRASDLGSVEENAEWKPVVFDARRGPPVAPNGTVGYRWGEAARGAGTCDLDGIDPALSLLGDHEELVEVRPPPLRRARRGGEPLRRGVPAQRVGGVAVTTVFDLLSRSSACAARACRAAGRRAMTTPSPTRRPGRRRSPESTPSR